MMQVKLKLCVRTTQLADTLTKALASLGVDKQPVKFTDAVGTPATTQHLLVVQAVNLCSPEHRAKIESTIDTL
jgi:hypothetical protein